jgi:cytochrome c oxidase subunit 4
MSTLSESHEPAPSGTSDAEVAAEAALESRAHHPPDSEYILIAVALAALTAIEVGIYYLHSDHLTIVVLLLLMVLKFSIVVGFFMHLRFDSPILRRLFVGGLSLAVGVYTIILFAFGIYHV